MRVLVLLLNLMGPKRFLRFLAGGMLMMLFFLYCFVHEAFDQPSATQRSMVSQTARKAVKPSPSSVLER
jgi:hypothetical protein